MSESSIRCPKCGEVIELTDALKKSIQEDLRSEYNKKWLEEKKKIEDQFRLKQQQLEEQIKKQLDDQYALQMRDFQNRLEEQSRKLKESQDKELSLLRRQRELEDKERMIQLELERKLMEERQKIQSDLISRLEEEYKLKDAEKEKTINDLRQQINSLKQKAEQGSQQLQGEVFELELEEHLRLWFPGDAIEAVKKGVHGGDVVHRVFDELHRPCGLIVWEAKRAKNWTKDWVDKIKEDMLRAKATLGIIVTFALPKDIQRIGIVEKVWVCDPSSAYGLALALRAGLIETSRAYQSRENMDEKMEILYRYLSGPEFRQKIEAITKAFSTMKKDLDAEKAAMQRIWEKRELQIQRVITNTAGLYGTLQGIIGSSLTTIPHLELPGGEDSHET